MTFYLKVYAPEGGPPKCDPEGGDPPKASLDGAASSKIPSRMHRDGD
jgi:hypothetical protein